MAHLKKKKVNWKKLIGKTFLGLFFNAFANCCRSLMLPRWQQ